MKKKKIEDTIDSEGNLLLAGFRNYMINIQRLLYHKLTAALEEGLLMLTSLFPFTHWLIRSATPTFIPSVSWIRVISHPLFIQLLTF